MVEELGHSAAGVPFERITIVPNMINNDCFWRDLRPPVPHSEPRPVLWVGRLNERKNWRDAVYVNSILRKRGLKIQPVFVLTLRSEDEVVHEFFNQLTLHDIKAETKVYFNLTQPQLGAMMRDMASMGGCYLSTARLESFWLSVVEANACGLPVVASAVGALPEHIRHGESGYLFPFGERLIAADMVEECLFVRPSRKRVLAGLASVDTSARREASVEQLISLL